MDIAIAPGILHRRQWLARIRYLLMLLALAAGLLALRQLLVPSIKRSDVRTALVEHGAVSTEVVAAGIVVPNNERVLSSPLTSRVQEVLVSLGSSVKKGDAILQLDSTQVDNEVRRLADELRLQELEIEGIRQQQQQTLRTLRNQHQLAVIEHENQKVMLERYGSLYQRNIVPRFEYESTVLAEKKAALQLQQLEQQIADTLAAADNQLQQNEIARRLLQQKLAEQQQLQHDTTLRASSDGIITVLSSEIGQNINVGSELARISDLSSFRVDATISDFYLHQVSVGMPVNVNVGSGTLAGKLSRILPAVENGTILLQIELAQPDSTSLKSNLRVEAAIITASRSEGLRVANGIVFNGAGTREVFVVQDGKAVKRRVQVGLSNSRYVEILSGLSAGDEIIISAMTDYQHLDQIAMTN